MGAIEFAKKNMQTTGKHYFSENTENTWFYVLSGFLQVLC